MLISIVIVGKKYPKMICRMLWISQESRKLYRKIAKNLKNDPFNGGKFSLQPIIYGAVQQAHRRAEMDCSKYIQLTNI